MKLSTYFKSLRLNLQKWIDIWVQKKDIPHKINELNTLANANPKYTAIITFSLLCFCLLLTIVASFIRESPTSSQGLFSNIEDISPVMAGKQRIEDIKQQQANDLRSFILQGQTLKKELDSLIALPNKSHADSLEILRKHKQLEIIVRHLNEKD